MHRTHQVLDAYFGPNGIEYSAGRIPMGSCDFSVETYSFDDVPGDYNLTHFDDGLEREGAQRVRGRGRESGAGSSFVRTRRVSWYRGNLPVDTSDEGAAAGETPMRVDG